jgi:hypothetical protein
MENRLKLIIENIEKTQKTLLSEAVLYEAITLLEAITESDLDNMNQAAVALTKAVAPVKGKIPLLGAIAQYVRKSRQEIDAADSEKHAAELTAYITEVLFQLDTALDFVAVKLMDLFRDKLHADTNDSVHMANLMSAKQAAAVSERLAKEFFKKEAPSFLRKMPFLKNSMSKTGLTQSQAKIISQSILLLSFSELQTFIEQAGQAGTMLDSIKDKAQGIEGLSKGYAASAWDFVKNVGGTPSIGGFRS